MALRGSDGKFRRKTVKKYDSPVFVTARPSVSRTYRTLPCNCGRIGCNTEIIVPGSYTGVVKARFH